MDNAEEGRGWQVINSHRSKKASKTDKLQDPQYLLEHHKEGCEMLTHSNGRYTKKLGTLLL